MSDYGYDSDEYDGYDDGWLYIAEEDHPADDLAERAVASPPLRDYDLDGSGYNSDYFEYWVDIEYNSDGWNDTKGPSKTGVSTKTTPGPKKRKRVAQGGPSQKKRRGAHGRQLAAADAESGDKVPPVLWQSSKERIKQQFEGPRPMPEEPQSFALLGDWRTRFGPEGGNSKGRKASVEHEAASDAAGQTQKAVEMCSIAPEEEGWEDEEGTAQEDEDGLENLISGGGLDPQALQRALEENLAASGAAPAGLDKSKLLASLLRMVSGEGEAEDIAGELAEDLFEQAEEEDPEGKNIAAWAAKQKGNAENGDEHETGTALEEASGPEPEAKSKATLPPTPPTNEASGIEEKGKRNGAKVTAPASVASGLRSRKRKAAEPEPDEEPPPRPKRATRSYAAPTASSKSKTTGSKGGKGKRG